jgi:hypothetical protein
MEQFLPGLVQAIILGTFTFIAIYAAIWLKEKKANPASSKAPAPKRAANPAAKPAPFKPAKFDLGMIAGGYTIVFFTVAIFDALYPLIKIDPNDMVGLIIVLDLLTAAAWIWGSENKMMRAIATLFAVCVTAMAALILIKLKHG